MRPRAARRRVLALDRIGKAAEVLEVGRVVDHGLRRLVRRLVCTTSTAAPRSSRLLRVFRP